MPKRDLVLSAQILNTAGCLGFAPDRNAPIDWSILGAFITNPISRRPRLATDHPQAIVYSGGFLIHTGLPNPGFHRTVQVHRHSWEHAQLPVIVHLMADRPEETRDMVLGLEPFDNILAVELGFAPLLADDIILLAVEMSRGELPIIVSLPSDQILRLGPQVLSSGAAAVSVAAPRGALQHNGSILTGRLFGPSLFPPAFELVLTASKAGLPIIGAGGISSDDEARQMLAAGALAVQLDACLWLPGTNKKGPVS